LVFCNVVPIIIDVKSDFLMVKTLTHLITTHDFKAAYALE